MAEFCLECLNKMNHTRLTEEDVIIPDELDWCEGCAQAKRTVLRFATEREKAKARRMAKRHGPATFHSPYSK